MNKTVNIGMRPAARPTAEAIDKWMEGNSAGAGEPGAESPPAAAGSVKPPAPKMKRLTIDIPDSLHRRVKSRCGQDGLRMADVIRDLLDQRFPSL
ncbi:MAG: plasmid partition protein ParG [Verrucomicrobiota bacterium]